MLDPLMCNWNLPAVTVSRGLSPPGIAFCLSFPFNSSFLTVTFVVIGKRLCLLFWILNHISSYCWGYCLMFWVFPSRLRGTGSKLLIDRNPSVVLTQSRRGWVMSAFITLNPVCSSLSKLIIFLKMAQWTQSCHV